MRVWVHMTLETTFVTPSSEADCVSIKLTVIRHRRRVICVIVGNSRYLSRKEKRPWRGEKKIKIYMEKKITTPVQIRARYIIIIIAVYMYYIFCAGYHYICNMRGRFPPNSKRNQILYLYTRMYILPTTLLYMYRGDQHFTLRPFGIGIYSK